LQKTLFWDYNDIDAWAVAMALCGERGKHRKDFGNHIGGSSKISLDAGLF